MAYRRGGVQSMEIDEPKKNVALARIVHPKSGTSKRECPSLSKGKVQACSAQVGCSKAQKAKMAVVKIEKHDEVKANPFPQQEPSIEEHNVPFLHITDLSDITPRFAIEGYVLNSYGTFKVFDPKIVKFFKADLVDSHNSNTITVVVGSSLISQFASFFSVGSFVQIEGSAIKTKNKADSETTTGVADGSTPKDRATLTFVNDRKEEYKSIKRDIDNGEVKTFVARNVGAFLGCENTLSILDLTILVPVHSKRLQSDLLQTYKTQVESLGYRKQVFGVLHFSNINGVLLETLCAICKSNKVHKTTEGLFCVTCQKTTTSYEIPKFQVKIKPSEGPVISARLVGLTVDEVLALGKTF
ncbi:hypothetical protein GOP47_0027332 [Adiantum capillus-veneris]|nr:hypothetical protein GOP47_0027332 [Adiantum capillus-veneris]